MLSEDLSTFVFLFFLNPTSRLSEASTSANMTVCGIYPMLWQFRKKSEREFRFDVGRLPCRNNLTHFSRRNLSVSRNSLSRTRQGQMNVAAGMTQTLFVCSTFPPFHHPSETTSVPVKLGGGVRHQLLLRSPPKPASGIIRCCRIPDANDIQLVAKVSSPTLGASVFQTWAGELGSEGFWELRI